MSSCHAGGRSVLLGSRFRPGMTVSVEQALSVNPHLEHIGLWTEGLNRTSSLVARAITMGPYELVVITAPRQARTHYPRAYDEVELLPGVRILTDLPSRPLDRVYIQMRTGWKWLRLARLARHTTSMGAITTSRRNRPAPWRQVSQLIELLAHRPLTSRIDSIGYVDDWRENDGYHRLGRRYRLGTTVHPKIHRNQKLSALAFESPLHVDGRRRYLWSFMGRGAPARRERILRRLMEAPEISGQHPLRHAEAFWRIYGSGFPETEGMITRDYLHLLRDSDFALCPPGAKRTTHRVVEALVCGSVPVLHADDLVLYEIGLRDGENCIAVEGEDWVAALHRIAGMHVDQKTGMRSRIEQLRARHLMPKAWALDLRARMGLPR